MKKEKRVQKPRNHVVIAMIQSGKTQQIHGKNRREEILTQTAEEKLEELYEEYDYD